MKVFVAVVSNVVDSIPSMVSVYPSALAQPSSVTPVVIVSILVRLK